MDEREQASRIASRAAEIMSRAGHCKYSARNFLGQVCFRGAVWAAEGQRDGQGSSLNLIEDTAAGILAEQGRDSAWAAVSAGILKHAFGIPAVDYNNRTDVTGEDVILLLKQCAHRLSAISPEGDSGA